jgi:hypothetical protein
MVRRDGLVAKDKPSRVPSRASGYFTEMDGICQFCVNARKSPQYANTVTRSAIQVPKGMKNCDDTCAALRQRRRWAVSTLGGGP